MLNPCCCLSLRTGAFLIGVLEIVTWSVSLSVSALGLFVVTAAKKRLTEMPTASDTHEQMEKLSDAFVATILAVILSFIRIVSGSVLLLGVQRDSLVMVKTWLCVKLLVVALTIGFFITSLAMGLSTAGTNIFYGFTLLASAYFIWIVIALISKMKEDARKKPIMFNRM